MDSAKKKLFHHSKKDEDDEPKKATAHPKVEEVEEEEENMSAGAKKVEEDPLDNEDAQEETAAPADEAEVDAESSPDEDPSPQKSPPSPDLSLKGEEFKGSSNDNGPKINFDYPQTRTPSDVARPVGGSNLDDLADNNEEEYDQANQPAYAEAPAGKPTAPRPVNPYAKQSPDQEPGFKSIRQSQPGPSFPTPAQFGGPQGGQNMNGNGNGGFRPQGQFGAPGGSGTPGNFNFRREGNSRGGSNKVYFVVLLVIGLIVLGGAVYLLKNQLKPAGPKATPAPEVAITTPEPSPTPEAMDRSKFTIRVLNGSGKTGLAKTVADKLGTLGYKIEKTGNATNSAFERTIVRTLNDASLSAQLVKDLSDQSYDAASGSALKKGDASDAEIILGAK